MIEFILGAGIGKIAKSILGFVVTGFVLSIVYASLTNTPVEIVMGKYFEVLKTVGRYSLIYGRRIAIFILQKTQSVLAAI